MELGHTPPTKPSSCAMKRRSTPKGLPASAPDQATIHIRSVKTQTHSFRRSTPKGLPASAPDQATARIRSAHDPRYGASSPEQQDTAAGRGPRSKAPHGLRQQPVSDTTQLSSLEQQRVAVGKALPRRHILRAAAAANKQQQRSSAHLSRAAEGIVQAAAAANKQQQKSSAHLSRAAAWPRAAAGRAGACRRAARPPRGPAASGSSAPPAPAARHHPRHRTSSGRHLVPACITSFPLSPRARAHTTGRLWLCEASL